MLLILANFLSHTFHIFRIFQYITFRAICSALTAMFIVLFYCPKYIQKLMSLQIGQVIRSDGPHSHLQKSGTPTMGGLLILIAFSISMLLWGDLDNRYIWIGALVTLGFGMIGCIDDYRKIVKKNSKGLSAKQKLLLQSLIAFIAISILYFTAKNNTSATQFVIPFLKNAAFQLGIFYFVFSYFVIVGASNAVNLTDGLDGLALMPAILVLIALSIFSYVAGNFLFSKYLALPYIMGSGELVVFCAALAGAGLGFLWYNTYPAQIFMGDVGSLSIGGALGVIAVMLRQELVLFIMGGIFVVETMSVILQVASFKLRKKRIFRMAPLHHHFELNGWSEPKIIVRFWIITVILVLIGLATLKLR